MEGWVGSVFSADRPSGRLSHTVLPSGALLRMNSSLHVLSEGLHLRWSEAVTLGFKHQD